MIHIDEAMKNAIEQIKRLQSASGSIKKTQILQEHKDNECFRRILYYTLNPMLTYKVSEETLRRVIPAAWMTHEYRDIFDVCEQLSARKALDDVTVNKVCSFLRVSDECEFYTKLLSKTLRLGVTAKTVNKVIPGLIPEWEVQQAYPIEKYPIKQGMEFWLTQKLNGVRATYYKGKLYARSGVPFEGLDHITSVFASLDPDNAATFDGELTLRDKTGLSDNEAFRVATGILNSDDGDKMFVSYTIFDVLPTKDFENGESNEPYSGRRNALDIYNIVFDQNSSVSVLPVLYHGTDQNKIDELLDQMVREDKEGLMLNLDTPYKCKRHKGILKVKRFYTMDLRIVDCEEGSGRLAGTLGAFVIDYKGNEVRVGSGFTDEQRAVFWKSRESLVGSLCEVKYKEISYDKNTGAESLQFPVFVSLRTDKDDVSFE